MAELKAIFWDMDGTMVNSEPLWEIATLEMSERMGKRMTLAQRERTIGGSFHNTYLVCCEITGTEPTPEGEKEQFAIMRDRMVELLSQELEPFPGVRELLGELRDRGIPMFVTTNTPRDIAAGAIKGIGEQYFTDSVCGDEVPNGKPAPDMYLEASRRAGARPDQCLVFEDSANGMKAAAAAGCVLIGIPEHADVPVPEQATLLATLVHPEAKEIDYGHRGFEGIHADDVIGWFEKITSEK
ncbi:MAG: HAD family phosphatase [Corynebacterium sp.]|nr:HAD family phosphatase [Corynebacterium sp.]